MTTLDEARQKIEALPPAACMVVGRHAIVVEPDPVNRTAVLAILATVQPAVERLVKALVTCALPYEALLADRESRKWIAPAVWQAIEQAVVEIRDALQAHVGTEKKP